ncbi:MAG: redoxin domain-containing protein [Paludibaculum sp.]
MHYQARPRRLLGSTTWLCLMFLGSSASLPAPAHGETRPGFALLDTTGAAHRDAEWESARAVVLFFVTTDCPLSNGYVPEMNRIAAEFGPRGVRVYAVLADPDLPRDEATRHARDFDYRFPVLFDPRQILARHVRATVTPEAAILTPAGGLLYLGRIDNSVERLGTKRFRPTVLDLRDALEAVLTGRPLSRPSTKAFGCAITYSSHKEPGQ